LVCYLSAQKAGILSPRDPEGKVKLSSGRPPPQVNYFSPGGLMAEPPSNERSGGFALFTNFINYCLKRLEYVSRKYQIRKKNV